MKKHDIFPLIFKSSYSLRKETVNTVLKELDNEIHYLSTVVLPKCDRFSMKSILKDIEKLRDQRELVTNKAEKWSKAYDEEREPRAIREIKQPGVLETETTSDSEKTYGLHEQRTIYASRSKSKKEINDVNKTIKRAIELEIGDILIVDGKQFRVEGTQAGVDSIIVYFEGGKTQEIKNPFTTTIMTKSISKDYLSGDKKTILKELYYKAWRTRDGLSDGDIEKMSEDEIDKAIEALNSIFEDGR